MEKLDKYRSAVISLLEEYANFGNPKNGLENQVITDTNHDQYQFVITGWQGGKSYVHVVGLHLGIKNEKVWVYQNNLDIKIGDELVERGIAKSDIVLAFNAPELRALTGFAVA